MGQFPTLTCTHHISPWRDAGVNQERQGTPHHGRQFITGRPILRDEGTMTDQEHETTAQENNAQNVTNNDATQDEEAEFNERGKNKEN